MQKSSLFDHDDIEDLSIELNKVETGTTYPFPQNLEFE